MPLRASSSGHWLRPRLCGGRAESDSGEVGVARQDRSPSFGRLGKWESCRDADSGAGSRPRAGSGAGPCARSRRLQAHGTADPPATFGFSSSSWPVLMLNRASCWGRNEIPVRKIGANLTGQCITVSRHEQDERFAAQAHRRLRGRSGRQARLRHFEQTCPRADMQGSRLPALVRSASRSSSITGGGHDRRGLLRPAPLPGSRRRPAVSSKPVVPRQAGTAGP